MTFEKLVEKAGIGLAILIAEENLPFDFWTEITFDDCQQIYMTTSVGSPLHLRKN